MRKLAVILLLSAWYGVAGAQAYMDKDSLLRLPDDTAKIDQLNDYARNIQSASPQKAISMLNLAAELSRKLDYDYGLAMSNSLRSGMYFYEMKLDSSRLLLEQAFALLAGKTDKASRSLYASLLIGKGGQFQQQQNTDSAIYYYLKGAAAHAENGYADKGIVAYYNISGIYRHLNDTARALAYAHQTRSIALAATDSVYLLRSLIVLGDAFVLAGKKDSVWWVAQTGMPMAEKLNMPFAIGMFHSQLGWYYSDSAARYDSAIGHYRAALGIFTSYRLSFEQALVLQNLGNVCLKRGDYDGAIRYLKEATALARRLDLNQVLFYTLRDLSLALEKTGNLTESIQYLREHLAVSDTLQQRNNRKMVMELEARYQLQKKEALLAVQQKDIQQKKFTIGFLLLGLATLVAISFLLYRNYQQKHKIHLHRITELETEKQLAATGAILKGEEQERTRLAKDLHDGLGGMLSGIKYSFQNMKGNLILTPENAQAFERSIDMLDSSIKEMRRVAHNMMPEMLVKYGLNVAMKEFCHEIDRSGVVRINYQSIGMNDSDIEQTTAITVYRIVQELVNNAIKHAAASHVVVQLQLSERLLSVTVEDNGKGFDTALLQSARGMGWSNIRNRVDFLKGKIDVHSAPDKGTSVLMEIGL